MFDFYNTFYRMGYLKIDDVKEACKWKCISETEYKEITGEDYTI
ncbi:XkdX family protein [Haloimpatiens massiliensis]|nr:XkdX family protein [Haloimpatiens massiliensis]